MKLGVTPWDFSNRSARGLTQQAALAESFGYGSFWLPESHFNSAAIPEPLMLLAGVAAGTDKIRLATTSYLLPLRNPLQAAEQVAVLDQLCAGRVTLGIGRGYAPAMLKAFDVTPSEKRQRFEHCLSVMQQAWSGEPVVVDDEGDSVVLHPLPVQRPHPPLWVAAFGPKALAQAGRLGLPYLASPMETMAVLEVNYQRHRAAASAAGHADIETVPIMRTVFVTPDGSLATQVRDRLERDTARVNADSVDDWSIVGEASFVRDKISEYAERLNVSHLIVTRLRIGGIDEKALRQSVETVVAVVNG